MRLLSQSLPQTRLSAQIKVSLSARPPVFGDAKARAVEKLLQRLAGSDAPILLIGETGTGKESAAHYVHTLSQRRNGPFVVVNCRALNEVSADTDLLGYERDAFPAALAARRGWFEEANGGTLLLDEVGQLPLTTQIKLLRVLQEHEVVRLGALAPIPVDVRVIATTNPDLLKATDENLVSEELFLKLSSLSLTLPPLRDRKDGLPALARHFLNLHGERLEKPWLEISPEAMDILRGHTWPGNLQELENTIHNAVLLAQSEVIGPQDLHIRPAAHAASASSFDEALASLLKAAFLDKEPDVFSRTTRSAVATAFAFTGQNQVRTAEALGISRNTLRTQLANLGSISPRRRDHGVTSKTRWVRIGYQRYGTLSVLKALGGLDKTLQELGFSVRWTSYAAGPSLLSALHAGEIDFGSTGDVPPIFAQAVGAPLVYVAHEPAIPEGVALVVPPESEIGAIADLRGRKIKFSRGSNVHYLVLKALEVHGLGLDDVESVYAEPSDPIGYVDGKDADAWALWDPLLQMAQQARNLRVLTDGAGLVRNHQFYLASKRFIASSKELIPILLQELQMAGLFVANEPAQAARLLSEKLDVEAKALNVAFSRLTHGARLLSRHVIAEQQRIADHFFSLGLLPKAISVSDSVMGGGAAARHGSLSL